MDEQAEFEFEAAIRKVLSDGIRTGDIERRMREGFLLRMGMTRRASLITALLCPTPPARTAFRGAAPGRFVSIFNQISVFFK